jgi:hypothetical protein
MKGEQRLHATEDATACDCFVAKQALAYLFRSLIARRSKGMTTGSIGILSQAQPDLRSEIRMILSMPSTTSSAMRVPKKKSSR